jgi:hypothetical protein
MGMVDESAVVVSTAFFKSEREKGKCVPTSSVDPVGEGKMQAFLGRRTAGFEADAGTLAGVIRHGNFFKE